MMAEVRMKPYRINVLTLFLILALLSSFSIYSIPICSADGFLAARVVEVKYPERVSMGEAFQVIVTVEYADSFYVDVGIRDVDRDEIVEALTLISNFHGPGLESHIFNLTAPRMEGEWRLEASTRAWWRNSWYGDEEQSTYRFDVKVSGDGGLQRRNAPLELTSQVRGLRFVIDGVEYNLADESLILELEDGVHELAVKPSIIGFENGTRLVFSRWSDGVYSNPRRIDVPGGGISLSPIYMRQHRLQVDSPIDSVRGEGWYYEDTEAMVEALPEVYEDHSIYKFMGWCGDALSTNRSILVLMDKPKRVEANWMKTALEGSVSSKWILTMAGILLTSSVINIAIIAAVNRNGKSKVASMILFILLISPLQASFIGGVNAASGGVHPSYTMVEIDGSTWRYWHKTGSDTCLIWLGGGVMGEEVFINPYWLESYNTMRFLQDLSGFYSIMAVEKGSKGYLQRPLNRMVYGELYKGGGFLEEARRWAEKQGFTYIYIVGYSVGGVAAAEESSINHPSDWSSPNGVILITTPVGRKILESASKLTGNLLILYGEHMTPLYVESGEKLFRASPPEVPFGDGWIHREFHVIPGTAHEVWTIAETGKYNPSASQIIVDFIEKAKILNHISVKGSMSDKLEMEDESVKLNMSLQIVERGDPYPWSIFIDGSDLPPSLREFAVYSDGAGVVAVSHGFPEEKGLQILLNLEKDALSHGIRILAFPEGSKAPIVLASLNPPVVNLKVSTGFPGIPIEVDGLEYLCDSKGRVDLNLTKGNHSVKVRRSIEFNNGTRLYFKGWIEDSRNETEMVVTPDSMGHLTANYVRQLLLEANSRLGDAPRKDWYDENSLLQLRVKRQIIRGEDGRLYIFKGWYPSGLIGEDGILYLNKPCRVEAVWKRIDEPPHSQLNSHILLGCLFLPILILFLATTFLAVRSLRHHRSVSK